MSRLAYVSDGRKSGKAPEKSNFSQTCNLLSQFLKVKGNLRDLNLGIDGKLEASGRPETSRVRTTLDLLNSMEKSDQTSTLEEKSMDVFPQNPTVGFSKTAEDATNKANSSKPATMEPETAQMTIFYDGQILVFDEFPTDKVREIMLLASKGSSEHVGFIASGANTLSNPRSNPAQDYLQRQPEAIGSDLPIARRASLHRFFEKRKDRATARAPYQVHNPSTTSMSNRSS